MSRFYSSPLLYFTYYAFTLALFVPNIHFIQAECWKIIQVPQVSNVITRSPILVGSEIANTYRPWYGETEEVQCASCTCYKRNGNDTARAQP